MPDGLLDVGQVAAYLGIPVKTVYAKTAAREWPFTKVGRRIRFSQAHLDAIVAAGEQLPIEAPTRLQTAARRSRRIGRVA